ncbi:MAG: AbrB/MazE/SpoVT family DNA-binding domain-containing protein [ANME-2 cluster archaeon]|nr:AbrB/MazE/SpoVT family DNA-binding domain-containing protein [ANME-2 cluster archaeon]
MTTETTVAAHKKGTNYITRIPAEVREALDIRPGWKLVWSAVGHVAVITARPITPEEIEVLKHRKQK